MAGNSKSPHTAIARGQQLGDVVRPKRFELQGQRRVGLERPVYSERRRWLETKRESGLSFLQYMTPTTACSLLDGRLTININGVTVVLCKIVDVTPAKRPLGEVPGDA